jgi:hypothetical protein
MQLRYRGTVYKVNTDSVNTVDSEITAKFLGNSYSVRQSSPSVNSKLNLYRYRGITYLKSFSD